MKAVFDNGFDCRITEDDNYENLKMLAARGQVLPTGIRFAWDGPQEDDHLQKAIVRTKKFYPSHHIMVYILTGWKQCSFIEAFDRAATVAMLGARPVIQRYVPLDWSKDPTKFEEYDEPELIYAMEDYFNNKIEYPSPLTGVDHLDEIKKLV